MKQKVVKISNLDDTLGFGVYKDKTWSALLKSDPKYLKWVIENTQYRLPNDIKKKLKNGEFD